MKLFIAIKYYLKRSLISQRLKHLQDTNKEKKEKTISIEYLEHNVLILSVTY